MLVVLLRVSKSQLLPFQIGYISEYTVSPVHCCLTLLLFCTETRSLAWY